MPVNSQGSESLSRAQVDEFVRLLSRHERRLYAFILAMVPDWTEADEIAQRVRVRLWEQFDQYDPSKDFGAWSRTIAYFLILADRKEATRHRKALSLSAEFLETISQRVAETADEVDSRRGALEKCLGRLGDVQRKLILRYYSGDEDRKQIAADLDRSFDALRQAAQRIRGFLFRCVEQTLRAEESA